MSQNKTSNVVPKNQGRSQKNGAGRDGGKPSKPNDKNPARAAGTVPVVQNPPKAAAQSAAAAGPAAGPASVAAPPAAAAPPKAPAPKFSDLHGWLKAFKHSVPEADGGVLGLAEEYGWPVMPSDRAVAVHGFSHLARDVATLYVLSQMTPGLKRAKVLDYYGSERNRRFNPATSGPYCTIDGKPSKEVLEVKWVSGPDNPIAGDRARAARPGREPLDPNDVFDAVLVTDVYQEGNSWRNPLSPETVLALCHRSRERTVYVVCRRFLGWAGADGTKDKEEGVWYRDGDNMIVFSPDSSSPAYPKHPDMKWLENRNVGGLDVSFLQQFGPFSVFRCAPQAEGAQGLGPQVQDAGEVNWIEMETRDWKSWAKQKLGLYSLRESSSRFLPLWVRAKLPRNRFLVHMPTFHQLSQQYGQRVATGINYDSCHLNVQRSFGATKVGKGLLARFPGKYGEIVRDTVIAVMNAQRAGISEEMYRLRQEGSEAERLLLAARSAATPAASSSNVNWLAVAGGLTAVLAIRWMTKRTLRVTSGSILDQPMAALNQIGFGDPTYVWRTRPGVATVVTAHVAAEETVRSCFPWFAKGLWIAEFACNFVVRGWGALPTLLMHLTADNWVKTYGYYGKVAAFALHLTWNCAVFGLAYEATDALATAVASGGLSDSESREFSELADTVRTVSGIGAVESHEEGLRRFAGFLRSHITAGRVDAHAFATAIPAEVTIPSYTSRTLQGPEHLRGKITITVDGVRCETPEEALERLDDCVSQPGPNVMYPICITNGLLWEPAKNDKNLLVAILHRTHADPFVEAGEEAKVRHQRWEDLATRAVSYGLFDYQVHQLPSLEECVAIMGRRGKRILNAHLATENRGENLTLRKTITEKWNETITAQKDMGDCVSMKPRAIINLDPVYHATMTQWSRALSDVLHELFDGRVHHIAGHPVRIYFASGFSQARLNELGEALASGETVIAAAGDDSCVAWGSLAPEGADPFGEADQRMFDQTQDEGPSEKAARVWLRSLGAPEWFIDLVVRCCTGPYRLKTKRLVVKGEPGTQMPTGITLTTVMNSLATILMYVFWVEILVRHPGRHDMAALGKKLGFSVKYHAKSELGTVTFLRGWWRTAADGSHVWIPLPSAVLKLGKILRNPVDITTRKVKGKTVRRSAKEAVSVVAWALYRCYQGVPLDYPILGPFLATLKRCGKWSFVHVEDVLESAAYKPKMGEFNLDREEAMQAVCARYGVERRDVEEAEALLSGVRSLPAYVEHSVFESLADVDYA